MLMEKSVTENGFIIDLSNIQNTSQLVFELSSIMEHPEVKGKNICLKLGKLDLKQSQLLSIKALIESMDATIAFIDTKSEQTEASAVSLGIVISELSSDVTADISANTEAYEQQSFKEESVEEKVEGAEQTSDEEDKVVEVHADMEISNPIETMEGIEDIYDEVSTEELSEVIPTENYEKDS